MAFCSKCGTELMNESTYCGVCGNHVINLNTSIAVEHSRYKASLQDAADKITAKFGLEKIEEFSLKSFFSEVFSKHDSDEIEELLSVGTKGTTPELSISMGIMPNPWIFFRILIGTIIAYAIFLYAYIQYGNVRLIPGLIFIGSFAVPFSVLILFFELNTPKNISIINIVQLVIVGGSLGLLLTLILGEITPFLGVFGASAAAFFEEPAKLGALLFGLFAVWSG